MLIFIVAAQVYRFSAILVPMKCSVIVANYNNATVIRQALQSIEQQTYTNWEVVIVDDGSTDDSLQTIESYLATVPDRTKYNFIAFAENKGQPTAKHVGVTNSTGKVVGICDPDDALHPEAIAKIMQAHALNPAASIVFTNLYRCNHTLKNCVAGNEAGAIMNSNLIDDKVSAFATFKRSAYDKTTGFSPEFKLASDKDLYFKLEETGDIIYVAEPLYFYRVWPKGVSQGFDNYVRSRDYRLLAIEKAVARRKVSGIKVPEQKDLNKLLSEIHLLQAEGLIYSEQRLGTKFLKHLGLAILYNPLGSINRKIKAAFILSRIKRKLKKQL
ncbi:glycosyltransferase family 2 protein [Pontibacter fetidus]|uniref:Glycosyltransferase family 2 protein n=1 Tax=Pontibacter fetidus TaxID=2700082 RepID=A0A6B2HA17_9BACT|nr:glycosyltransferase family 2 protein [Pontibacter fetidus]NDK56224.1 glycosyltransferase family 2 protein [Pontibacter fetidus]